MLFGPDVVHDDDGNEIQTPLLRRSELDSDSVDGGPPIGYIPSAIARMGGSGSAGSGLGMRDAVRHEREASADLMAQLANDGVDDDALCDAEDLAVKNMHHNQQANQIMLALNFGGGPGSPVLNGHGGFATSGGPGSAGGTNATPNGNANTSTSRQSRLTWDLPAGHGERREQGGGLPRTKYSRVGDS